MKCPKCGNEMAEGKLLCENCGEEVKYVPDFDIELEDKLKESISSMIEELADNESEIKEYDDMEDLKDELRDYFPARPIRLLKSRRFIIAVMTVIICIVCMTTVVTFLKYRENSYEYQYKKALKYAENNDYAEAVLHLERAWAIDASYTDTGFLLAEYYYKNGMNTSAVSLLKEILLHDENYAKRDLVYDMLLKIYEEQENYEIMGEILAECDVPRIVSKYNKYAAMMPVFNKTGGNYDELISITLEGNTQGFVYYTLDGSTPTINSPVYETPILLEAGEYVIRAMFVNMYGVKSEISSESYFINLSVPANPVISINSGTYYEPALIVVYHNDDTKIYYTMDGSVPDKSSERYSHPIELPYGMSNFSFIAINGSGVSSDIVNRSYQLNVDANFDTELAVQVLKNNLWASGKLLNTEGNVPDKLGLNQYRVQTVVKMEDTLYYIVYEEYMDTTGRTHDTNNIYAIDVNTADLYTAYKIDEGVYNLRPFE